MPVILICDICGSQESATDDGQAIVCGYHRAEKRLEYLRKKYKEKRDWIKSRWLSELAVIRKEIIRLEKYMAQQLNEKEKL